MDLQACSIGLLCCKIRMLMFILRLSLGYFLMLKKLAVKLISLAFHKIEVSLLILLLLLLLLKINHSLIK